VAADGAGVEDGHQFGLEGEIQPNLDAVILIPSSTETTPHVLGFSFTKSKTF
jgi:hypothetical protein